MKLILFVLAIASAWGQTSLGTKVVGQFDAAGATSTKPFKSGTSVPGSCAANEWFFKNDTLDLYKCSGGSYVLHASGGGTVAINAQTGTTYTLAASDCGKLVTITNASPVAVTVPVASTPGAGCVIRVRNNGTGAATLTSAASALNGTVGGSIALLTGYSTTLYTNGTDYFSGEYTRINFGAGFSAAARNPVTGEIDVSATQDAVIVPYTNDGTTGTTQYRLTTTTSAGNAVIASTSTTRVVGVAETNAGTAGTVFVRQTGRILLRSEGNTTAGDYIGISTSTAGAGTSSATCPSGQVIGFWEQTGTGAADRYAVIAFGICTAAGGGATPTTNSYTSTSTFTPAASATRVFVRVWGAGGGGSGSNFDVAYAAGGGGGGYVEGWCAVTGGVGVTVTVGAGGTAGTGSGDGGAGGNSSFGSCLTATGGAGALKGSGLGGMGGRSSLMPDGWRIRSDNQLQTGQGGSHNALRSDQGANGANGQPSANTNGNAGGWSLFGGGGGGAGGNGTGTGGAGGVSGYGGAGGTGGNGNNGTACTAGAAPGGGGGGGATNGGGASSGCAGGAGRVEVTWYGF